MSSSLHKRTGQSQQADRSATSFSDLSDDVLGMVYGRLEDGAFKRSFRHASSVTWKSPAVNAQISTCTVDGVERPVRALQDFPRHAELKEVCFMKTDDVSLEEKMREALGLRSSCLSTVSAIRLKDWNDDGDVTGITAAALSLLFPKLESGQSALYLEACDLDPSFFRALFGRAHGLHKLHLSECYGADANPQSLTNEILPLLSGLPLTSLLLDSGGFTGGLPTQALAGLRQLKELHIQNAEVEGFEEVLPQLTCLSTLVLKGINLTGMRLISPCLRTLKLDSLPQLNEKAFPSLKLLQMFNLHFLDLVELGDGSDGSVMSVLSDLALCLSSLPVEVKLGDDNGSFSILMVREHLITPMLQALLPLRQSCQDVTFLYLDVTEITNERSLALLSCVFQNLSVLHLSRHVSPSMPLQDVRVSKFLENIRSLKVVRLPVKFVPSDLLATLQSAGLQRRAFVLELIPQDSACRSGLQLVADLWQSSRHLFPSVDLKVV